MKNTIQKVFLASLLLVFACSYSQAYANEHYQKKDDMEGMFFKKIHAVEENQEELGLTEDKIQAIKKLKIETEKNLVKQDADIKIASIDLTAKMQEYPIDVTAVDKLIDQKYELKKSRAKDLVDAIAKVKGSLTKEQYDKLCQIWKEGKRKPFHKKMAEEFGFQHKMNG